MHVNNFIQLGTLAKGFKLLSKFKLESLHDIGSKLKPSNKGPPSSRKKSDYVDFIIDNLPRRYGGRKDLMVFKNKVGWYVKVIFLIHLISCQKIKIVLFHNSISY